MDKKLTIYYTSDTHGFLFPTDYTDRETKPTGLLNCINGYRKDGNTLIIDGGDTLQGSPLAKYYIERRAGDNPMAAAFNAGGYDYVVPGNHDFNFGHDTLRDYFNVLSAKVLCSNVKDKTKAIEFLPSKIHPLKNGLRVGLVGIVTEFITVLEASSGNLKNFEVTDAFDAAEREFNKIRELCDITICVYHGGYEKDIKTGALMQTTKENVGYRICEELDFDILLTAHQHAPVPGRLIHGTYTLQLPPNAGKYALITAEVNPKEINISSSFKEAGSTLASVPYVRFKPLEDKVQAWLDERAGTLAEDLTETDTVEAALRGSPVRNFFHQVQLDFSGADISCVSLMNVCASLPKKPTIRNLFKAYPFPNSLAVIEVGGDILRRALERCAEFFELDSGVVKISKEFLEPAPRFYHYDTFSGISYIFDLRRPKGKRVIELLYEGGPIGNKKLTMCLSDYRSTGTGGYEFYRDCKIVKQYTEEVFGIALAYLSRQKNVPIEVVTGTDIKVIR
jgi:2',3'-cyclic-nucleotide 2'-phosphodiesterase/3'-nucleotidase